jgi:hypothetical protein
MEEALSHQQRKHTSWARTRARAIPQRAQRLSCRLWLRAAAQLLASTAPHSSQQHSHATSASCPLQRHRLPSIAQTKCEAEAAVKAVSLLRVLVLFLSLAIVAAATLQFVDASHQALLSQCLPQACRSRDKCTALSRANSQTSAKKASRANAWG